LEQTHVLGEGLETCIYDFRLISKKLLVCPSG